MSVKVAAMILAGGKGTRLESLTKKIAKPAVCFGAKYRIIDFPLSNCANSNIPVVGVLTQYESTLLDNYLGNGEKWGYNGARCLLTTLTPRQTERGANWYKGTADAIAQNIDFLDSINPSYVLILSGDHIYKTRFDEMIDLHEKSKADVTISVIEVDKKEASRFGIMSVDNNDRIKEFEEKPKKPKSNLASMGIYVFSWKILKKYLLEDALSKDSEHDFGKNIIPKMLKEKKKLQAYRFKGYWRDVGTITSLHEANMDLISGKEMNLYDGDSTCKIFTRDIYAVPQYVGPNGFIAHSLVNQGAIVLGKVKDSVISNQVVIEENVELNRCVVMDKVHIYPGAKINNAIIASGSVIKENEKINLDSDEIMLIAR